MSTRSILLFFVFIIVLPMVSKAKDIPKEVFGQYVQKVPTCFHHMGKNICEGFHWDTITIQPKTPEVAFVSIETETINGHGCAFRGVGKWDGQKLVVISSKGEDVMKPGYLPKDTPWDACKISVIINGDMTTYNVEQGTESYCHSAYCSARGWLGYPKGVRPQYRRKK